MFFWIGLLRQRKQKQKQTNGTISNKEFLHSKGNHQHNEKATYQVRESI